MAIQSASDLIDAFDIYQQLDDKLQTLKPDIVINTCGPFQEQDYTIASACIKAGCHYIDLADSTQFVYNIIELNEQARQKQVSIISGASSVHC